MIYFIAFALCALLYAIKGGHHGVLRRKIAKLAGTRFGPDNEPEDTSIPQEILWTVMDGKIVSATGFGLLAYLAGFGFLFPAAGWLLGVAPSVGEEIGAVGGIKGNWRAEGRVWGWKKGFIRGVFLGAMLAVAFDSTAFIWACAPFPIYSFIGVSIEQLRTGTVEASWRWHEWITGGAIGLALAAIV